MIVRYDDDKFSYERIPDFPKQVDEIVDGQLDGCGFHYAYYDGNLVVCDDCYSNDGELEIEEYTPQEVLEKAIGFRLEILEEDYGCCGVEELASEVKGDDIKYYNELLIMNAFLEYMEKAEKIMR